MNLSELRAEWRRALRETSATKSAFTDADGNKFINEGIKDICIKGLAFSKTKTVTVSTTVASYPLPFDYLRTISLLNPSSLPIIPISPAEVGTRYIVTGYPLYYYESQTLATLVTRAKDYSYAKTALLVLITANGFMYEVTVAGKTLNSDTPSPTYPIDPGTAVADGTATVACRELITYLYAFTLVDTPTTTGAGTGTYTLIYNALDEGLYVDTDAPNFPWDKHHFLVDFACWRALSSTRQTRDGIPFITNYAKNLGLNVADYIGGGAQG